MVEVLMFTFAGNACLMIYKLDHNTLYESEDGVLDVTRGSTDITISNNWFKNPDKVMLLGYEDGFLRDKNMKVTVMYNHFGPNCNQRMPSTPTGLKMIVIDHCWRWNPDWQRNRQQLATCLVGYARKMTNNIGRGLTQYVVTNPSDNPINPKPRTLRYGTTMIKGKRWITFQRSMRIRLEKPLLISSFTTIDGRGASVHIAGNACLMIYKVWLDHNTIYESEDVLLDVTRDSTDITISNKWFKNQGKVMLLGHDGFLRDKNMKVTVMYNNFGPNCNQRMP
uniref:Pectate lyase n=1 Tax=Quercus lobata TaxID=97700 RepID=A0A7N2N5F1_QUELO